MWLEVCTVFDGHHRLAEDGYGRTQSHDRDLKILKETGHVYLKSQESPSC